MNPPDPTGDGVPGAFTVYGGGLATDLAGPSRASAIGKKMPKVFAGWRFVLAPPSSSSLRLHHRPARGSVTFERELEPGMDVLREQTPEPTGFDSDEADPVPDAAGDAIDDPIVVIIIIIVVVAFRGGSPRRVWRRTSTASAARR